MKNFESGNGGFEQVGGGNETGWESTGDVPFAGDMEAVEQSVDTPKTEAEKQAVIDNAHDDVMQVFKNKEKAAEEKTIEEIRNERHERIKSMMLTDEQLIEKTSGWANVKVNEESLSNAYVQEGTPNSCSRGLFFGENNLPVESESIYRHVGTPAITDLFEQGYVRNAREAVGAMDDPDDRSFRTSGATVYWEGGIDGQTMNADLVIQARRDAAEKGYITKDDIIAIWVTDKNTGQPVNLIDGQDHTGLEIGKHMA